MVTPGACRCGSRRRWRLLSPDGNVGCWRCLRCADRPPAGARVDIANAIRGEARALFAVPAVLLTDEMFALDLARHGAPLAMDAKPLPCRCRVCSPRAGQRSAA